MRWFSVCVAVGALLASAIDARPLKHSRCRPSVPSGGEYSSSTVAGYPSSTSTRLDPVIPSTTSTEVEYTPDPTPGPEEPEPTPEPTPEPEPEPEPELENLLSSGDFEGDNSVWGARGVTIAGDAMTIEDDPDRAASPTHYALWEINDRFAGISGRYLNQTVTSLEAGRLFRLSFSGAVFGFVDLKESTCNILAVIDNVERARWVIDASVAGQYRSYSREFVIEDEDVVVAFDLICDAVEPVTINFGMDDIVLNDVGPAPDVNQPV